MSQNINNQHNTNKIDNNISEESSVAQRNLSQNPNQNSQVDEEITLPIQQESIVAKQAFNEDLIKLLVLLYQIDGKVTLTEQDYFETLIQNMEWKNGVSISAFINDAIHQTRVAIDHEEAREFLFSLANGLSHDPAQALEHAMNISAIDGKRSEEELEILALLSNRVLARGLVA